MRKYVKHDRRKHRKQPFFVEKDDGKEHEEGVKTLLTQNVG